MNRASEMSRSVPAPSTTAPMNRIAPTGSSATTEVLIDRTRVWFTARFTDSDECSPGLHGVLGGVLPDLVEHHDGVVQRVAEDREEADDRRRGDLESETRVDADGDDEVVQQSR